MIEALQTITRALEIGDENLLAELQAEVDGMLLHDEEYTTLSDLIAAAIDRIEN